MKISQSSFLIFACVAFVLTGCATSKVEQVKATSDSVQFTKADSIYVKDFDATNAIFKGEYSSVPEKVAVNRLLVQQIISMETINRLIENGYTAHPYSADAPSNTVIVEGKVTLVDSGSAATRFWVGFSAGASTVQANVKIYRASEPDKILTDLQIVGSSGGRGGISGGYKDWVEANSKDLGIKLGDYIMGKK